MTLITLLDRRLDQIELIARAVHRTPDVMIKVLSRGGPGRNAVAVTSRTSVEVEK